MAPDTREDVSSQPTDSSKSTSSPSTGTAHEPSTAPVLPPPNANILSGAASLNTAGGRIREASWGDALRSFRLRNIQEVHKIPCARDAYMTGIASGFGVGGVRAILGATVWTSCNWAVGTFVFGSLLMFEYCQRKRDIEMQGMKRAFEAIDRRQAEKRKKPHDEARAARRKAKDES